MFRFREHFILCVSCCLVLISADPSPDCIVTEFSQLDDAIDNCDYLVVRNLTVPGGSTVFFNLKDGATLTFEGTTTFEYYQWPEWANRLMHFQGNNITVQGAPGSLLNGQGELYWDGIGDSGVPKPFFMVISVQDSIFRNINLLNCPHHCTILEGSDGVTLTNWNIDCSYGEDHGGKNTDGFDIISANNVVIKDSSVVNQDDCVAVNQGFNMSFSGLYCNGTHGISLSVGFSQLSYVNNTVKNVTYSNCTLVNSDNAIHIKTHTNGGPGEITDITYENIRFSDVHKYGVNIQEDYANGRGTGIAKANIPIRNLVFRDIRGTLTEGSGKTMPVYIFCADGGCANWSWSDVSIGEGGHSSWCNFTPDGYVC